MVYTVTFNPAVDYVIRIGELRTGNVNRSSSEQIFWGGKGINVSVVLKELGVKSKALGFTAGFTGRAIEDGLRSKGVETDFVDLPCGCSRINVKIRSGVDSEDSKETEINGGGPDISAEALDKLYEKLDALANGDVLVLAGSIPNSLPRDIYEKILARLSGRGIKAVVDAAGELLLNTLKYKPFLVKPNDRELCEMFGAELKTEDDILFYAKKLREMGAANVLVSMAGDGAILLDENGKTHRCKACRGTVKNSVGAGDSMVAGFIAGLQDGDHAYALRLGTAAGGATAFSDDLAKRDDIFELLKQCTM